MITTSHRKLLVAALGLATVPVAAVGVARSLSPQLLAWMARPLMHRPRHVHPLMPGLLDEIEVLRELRVEARPGLPAYTLDVYRPKDRSTPAPLLIWWHGGGFIGADKATIASLAAVIARAGYAVATPNYALAPEHPYPVAVLQGNDVLGYLMREHERLGIDPTSVVLGGESAGGALALQVLGIQLDGRMRQRLGVSAQLAGDHVRGAVIYCAPTNMATLRATRFPVIDQLVRAYTGVRDWQRFDRLDELSAVRWVSPGWPPMYLSAGDADPLRTQMYELAEVLSEHGVAHEDHFREGSGEGLPHAFELYLDTPPGQEALASTLAFLQRVLPVADR